MFKKLAESLRVVSWYLVIAMILFVLSLGYMLFSALITAIYFALSAIFFLGLSFRE